MNAEGGCSISLKVGFWAQVVTPPVYSMLCPVLMNDRCSLSFLTDGQPEIAVFDKTLQIKQMHVLEMLDLLLTRVDKGEATCHLVTL